MLNIQPHVIEQIRKKVNRPEGSVELISNVGELFNPNVGEGIILEISSGAQYFLVKRDSEMQMIYYYSSPGSGTWVAKIDLKKVQRCDKAYWGFTWSPQETKLFIGPWIKGGKLVISSIKPNLENLVNMVFSQSERDIGVLEILKKEAVSEQKTFLEKIAINKINFQNYD